MFMLQTLIVSIKNATVCLDNLNVLNVEQCRKSWLFKVVFNGEPVAVVLLIQKNCQRIACFIHGCAPFIDSSVLPKGHFAHGAILH